MWTDQVDQANDLAERERAAMSLVRKPTLVRTGHCYACDEVVAPSGLFCDAECQELWARDQRAAAIRGHHSRGM